MSHFGIERAVIAGSNVRAKPGPTVKRQARAADDDMHCSAGLAFCRWGSA